MLYELNVEVRGERVPGLSKDVRYLRDMLRPCGYKFYEWPDNDGEPDDYYTERYFGLAPIPEEFLNSLKNDTTEIVSMNCTPTYVDEQEYDSWTVCIPFDCDEWSQTPGELLDKLAYKTLLINKLVECGFEMGSCDGFGAYFTTHHRVMANKFVQWSGSSGRFIPARDHGGGDVVSEADFMWSKQEWR